MNPCHCDGAAHAAPEEVGHPPHDGATANLTASGHDYSSCLHVDASTWRVTVDNWVRDKAVRRDGLIAVGMVLLTLVVLGWVVLVGGAAVLAHPVTRILGTVTGQTASCVVGSVGAGAIVLRRRNRSHRNGRNHDLRLPHCRFSERETRQQR